MYTTLNNAKLTTPTNTSLKEKPLSKAINTSMPVKGSILKNDALVKAVKHIANKTTTQSATATNNNHSGDTKPQTIEGVKVEGYDTLDSKQKATLKTELQTYKNKINKSIQNGNFDKFMEKAFGRKVDNPQELAALKKAALNGNWDKVIPQIKIGSQADFATAKNANGQSVNAMGAFIKGSGEGGATGTIIMNKELLNGPVKVNGKAMTFQNVLTEEVGHAWDARLNKTDSKGDEGEALSLLFTSVDKTGIALQKTMNAVEKALNENDHGTMTVTDKNGNEKTIEVEFGFFSRIKKAFKKGIKKIGKAFKKVGKAVVDGVKKAGKAIVKGVKKLAQSKIFAVVLQVAQFIPVLAPFVAVARGAMAAYNVYKGIKDGNLMQAISGVAGGALGGAAKVLGASASTISSLGKVASFASKASSVASTYNAVKNGDITGALMSGATVANGAGFIDQNTMSNIQNIAKITNVVQTGDISRGVQLGLQYANGSDWAQENQSGINKINSAFNLYQSVANGSDADRISAAASFGQQMGIINDDTADNIQSASNIVSAVKERDVNRLTDTLMQNNVIDINTATKIQSANNLVNAVKSGDVNQMASALSQNNLIDVQTATRIQSANNFVSAVKSGDVNEITNTLAQNNIIDEQVANRIQSANNLVTAVKKGDVNQFSETLLRNKVIDKNTADNVTRLSDYYKSAKQHGSAIEQMIRTKNFNLEAANDAYQFLKTGTDNSAVAMSSTINQGSNSAFNPQYSPSYSTPGIMGGFANSFSGDDKADKTAGSMPNFEDLKPLPKREYPPETIVLEPIVVTAKREPESKEQSILTTGADIVTDFIPGVSNIKDGTIALTGVNPITGEKVGWGGRVLSGIFALPVVGNATKYIARGGEAIYKGVKSVSAGAEISQGVAKSTKHTDEVRKAENLKQTGSGSQIASADKAHDAIRASTTDIDAIAKNTGIKPSNIQKVKDHLFHNEHLLDRYVDYGVPAVKGRFDSDIGIANAWKRLETGNHTVDDMKLLKHETAEAWYMKKNGSGYTKAHDAAENRYPAPKMESN